MEEGIVIRTRAKIPKLPDTFDALNAEFPLRPITDEIHLDHATSMSDRLAVLDKRTADQDDYLETLSLLIEKYEAEHHAIDTSGRKPVDILQALLEGRGMNASDLGRLLGERSLGAAILRGERAISKAHMKSLAEHFRVSPALFLD
jgi:HTH-type transcriptional regulator/antitoxin HigA